MKTATGTWTAPAADILKNTLFQEKRVFFYAKIGILTTLNLYYNIMLIFFYHGRGNKMTVLSCFLAFFVGLWSINFDMSPPVLFVDESQNDAPSLSIKVDDLPSDDQASISFLLHHPPIEGIVAVFFRVSCSDLGQIIHVEQGDVSGDMTLTYRMYEKGAVILLDAEKNMSVAPLSPLIRLTVKGKGRIRLTVESAVLYTYKLNEEMPSKYDIFPVTGYVNLPSTDEIESATEEETKKDVPSTKEDKQPLEEDCTVKGKTVYVGCQETLPRENKYSVRFLFLSEDMGQGTAVYLRSSTGQARVKLTVETSSQIIEQINQRQITHSATKPTRWCIWTFDGLSAEERYAFVVMNPYECIEILHDQGTFIGHFPIQR